MMKRHFSCFTRLLFACVFLLTAFVPASAVPAKVALEDDFYTAVNESWLDETTLFPNQSVISGFSELASTVHLQLFTDFAQMDRHSVPKELEQFLSYFHMALDFDTRNAFGVDPILPYIERILALESIDCLKYQLDDWILDGLPTPFSLYVAADMADANYYTLYAAAPNTILPDISYYDEAFGEELLTVYMQVVGELLGQVGIENAAEMIRDALLFDQKILQHAMNAGERSNYAALYHPVDFSEFFKMGERLDFESLIENLIGKREGEIILNNPAYFAAFDEMIREENFHQLKHWMLTETLFSFAPFLDETFSQTAAAFQMAQTGQEMPTNPADKAFHLATNIFAPVVGDYYGKTYFGEQARLLVTEMACHLTETFAQRLRENTWLSEKTKQGALEKLDSLQVHIGYPDEIPTIYEKFIVTSYAEGGNLLDNTLYFANVLLRDMFSRYQAEVDRTLWNIPAHMVNACYAPMTNTIIFPAAILQEPFFSINQSMSQNYGGIGTIIAHEITHAFDLNGAHFGPDGSLLSWWCEQDFLIFEEKAEKMLALFDGLPHEGGFVDGRFTLSENIADAGGLICALQALQSLPEHDFEEFFTHWATTWRMKATPEYHQLLLNLDCHAPAKLRANMQLSNLDLFYESYEIEEHHGMYVAPQARVVIW